MLMAGYETSANTLVFCIYLLSKPSSSEKLVRTKFPAEFKLTLKTSVLCIGQELFRENFEEELYSQSVGIEASRQIRRYLLSIL